MRIGLECKDDTIEIEGEGEVSVNPDGVEGEFSGSVDGVDKLIEVIEAVGGVLSDIFGTIFGGGGGGSTGGGSNGGGSNGGGSNGGGGTEGGGTEGGGTEGGGETGGEGSGGEGGNAPGGGSAPAEGPSEDEASDKSTSLPNGTDVSVHQGSMVFKPSKLVTDIRVHVKKPLRLSGRKGAVIQPGKYRMEGNVLRLKLARK